MSGSILELLYRRGAIGELDLHFARFIGSLSARLGATESPDVSLAAALASNQTSRGHICLHVEALAGKLASEALEADEDGSESAGEGDASTGLLLPELSSWVATLRRSPVVGEPGDFKPLVLDTRHRLYLCRYWRYEHALLERLQELAAQPVEALDVGLLRRGLARLFPGGGEETDWQKVAAFTAVARRLCVVSGGPGTGKTSTVAKILVLLLEQAALSGGAARQRLRIALAAPTGKAAARLEESIKEVGDRLDCPESLREELPAAASTLHRLLGSIPGSSTFRFNASRPLPVDVVVVDEASMVDLALMAKLVTALPPRARLILLGDRDQLASVEAGAVLGDLCSGAGTERYSASFRRLAGEVTGERIPAAETPGAEGERGFRLGDSVVLLTRGYRFGRGSGIGAVSRAVNVGDGEEALSLLKSGEYNDVAWLDVPPPDGLRADLEKTVPEGFVRYLQARDPEEAFERFNRFRILCALRSGPYGVDGVNRLVEEVLRKRGLLRHRGVWYPGRPVLITANDYALKLFNGDIGIVLPDPESDGRLRAFFQRASGDYRRFPPLRLPECETAFAMTVHKSQGSEFDEVLLLLPRMPSRVVSRELIYTGLTRARTRAEVWGSEEVLGQAVAQRIQRTSGLREALWG